ncbi:MAG: fibronectin type III domain-containing protein [Sedimentisphaerales bacterium]
MQSSKAFIVLVSFMLLGVLHQPVFALTFDYLTTAKALAEVGWYDSYLGLVAAYDYDPKEANNARSYATAYYDEIQFMGNVGISALADASVEPNEVILSAEVTGSYEFDIGWELMEYFYQDANGTVEGLLRIDEFPAGAPCRLQIDISFPNETWKSLWAWQLYIESSSGYFVAGRDDLGDYGGRSGTLDAYAGEEIYVFLGFAGRGYADHYTEALGYGKFTINATLTATKKVMAKAFNPTPADGCLYNDTSVSLGWWPGNTAISHDVYFGISFDDVNDGTNGTFQGNQAATSFIAGSPGSPYPDGLVPGTTYYWRIDEVQADGTKHKGDIWSFWTPPRTAYDPNPADGAEFVDPNATLSWVPGFEAKSHTVYFGDNFNDVNNTSGGPSQESTTYTPDLLESEKVYYWRVDEYDGVATYKGNVWGFTTPGAAGSLQPANGAIDVQMNSTLNWTPATTAVSHDVYFGTDKDAVRNATTASPEYKGNKALGTESCDPGKLSLQSDYYWRVDAIYNTGTVKGLVWSFTTADFITVDDFEDYDIGNNEIWWSWKDGLGYAAHDNEPAYPGNGTGSAVGDETTLSYTEETIVHSGRQSMPLSYDNNKQGYSKYSEVELTLNHLRDWTENGVNTLTLWFIGDPGNDAEPLYVAVSNSTGTPAVVVHDDPAAAQIDTWIEWLIPLSVFANQGIVLTNVDRIAIGLGTKGNMTIPGGFGKMNFDDIRLYRPTEEPHP